MREANCATRRWNRVVLALGLAAAIASSAAARTGNYLIMTPPDFAGTTPLLQFVAHKTAQGFTVSTHTVTAGTSNTDIRNYILSLWGTASEPDYVLLIGDTAGSTSTSSTIPHFTGGGSKHATTDLPYGCMDSGDDWHPEIPVGRFSVTSTSSLQAVVDKTLFVEAGVFPDPEYVKRGAFLANPGTQGMAEPTHDWVIDNYFVPNGYEGIRIYSALGGNTQDVFDAVNNGCLWVGYYGHSGSSGWWDPSFDQSDVRALSNAGLYGVAWSFSCNVGNYSNSECFGETWLREANKGAAAVIFPSYYIYWGSVEAWRPSTILEHSFFASFFEDDIWEVGPAWQKALYAFEHDFDGSEDIKRNFFELYNVLGDPSLLLPQPLGFTLDPEPDTQSLCCPPTTDATFTIEVGKMGDFDEAVTLTLGAEPVGSSVSFSVNDAVPPFTSVLTLGNLDQVNAGSYSLTLTGTSLSMQRATGMLLNIASDIPSPVTLLSPPDGASGVALMPELTWAGSPLALSYDVDVATDSGFANIVYSNSLTVTSCTVNVSLGMLTPYYWRVRASNTCGIGDYSETFGFTTVNMIMPTSYDMLNGETGTYTYFDDSYNGLGNNSQPLSPLSEGLGDLTDGVIATQHWNSTSGPYVGWVSVDPTITFHFAEPMRVDVVTLQLDDDGGGGGVHVPTDVTITMGGTTLVFPVSDPAGESPFAFSCADLGMAGDTLEITLADYSTSGYMMLSEIEFYGGPDTGACCIAGDCSITTEDDCVAGGGEYEGDGTGCDPNPCFVPQPTCLIISEIVHGAASGGCPKWIEITNTGLENFVFNAGGIIIQMDDSTDLTVDVDLAGVVVRPGESLVVNANDSGACTGAFQYVYGFEAPFNTNALFGDGNDRYILTDTADGSHLLDIYGELGVNGAGELWEYTNGFSYRLPQYNTGDGGSFSPGEWVYGGPGSLVGANPELLLLKNTTPSNHMYDEDCLGNELIGDLDCDGDVDFDDINPFVLALSGEAAYYAEYPDCNWHNADCDEDGDVDFDDINPFVALLGS